MGISNISAGIVDFYRNEIAHQTIKPIGNHASDKTGSIHGVRTIHIISRFKFLSGVTLATLFLIRQVAITLIFVIGTIICFGNQGCVNSIKGHGYEAIVYAGAIPVGLAGFLLPQITNEKYLEIPSDGLVSAI